MSVGIVQDKQGSQEALASSRCPCNGKACCLHAQPQDSMGKTRMVKKATGKSGFQERWEQELKRTEKLTVRKVRFDG